MEEHIYKYLLDRNKTRRSFMEEFLSDGGAKDYAEYRDLCGVIRGLTIAQQEIEDLVRKLKKDDDDDSF